MRIKIILLFAAVMTVQAAIIGLFIVSSLQNQLMNDYKARHQQMTDLLSWEFAGLRRQVQSFTITVLGDRRLQNFLRESNGQPPGYETRSIIRTYMNYNPNIRGIYLVDTSNNIYSNIFNHHMHNFIIQRMPKLDMSLGNAYWSSAFSDDTIIVYRRVNDLDSLTEKIGALFIVFDIRAFTDPTDRFLTSYQLTGDDLLIGSPVPENGDYQFFINYFQNWRLITWIDNNSVYQSLRTLPPMLIGGFATALFIAAVLVFIVSGKLTRILVKQIRSEEMKRRVFELKTLQYQINPHFLYNTLDCINMIAIKNKNPEISHYVAALSGLFRLSLNQGKDFISVSDEFKHSSYYLRIQSMRFPEQFKWTMDIQDSIGKKTILKFLLQPLIENSINHGLRNSVDDGFIDISAKSENGMIMLEVKDNGTGMSPDQLNKLKSLLNEPDFETNPLIQGGFGLRNVNQRLKLYYGEEYGLTIESEWGEGTVIKINIPEREE